MKTGGLEVQSEMKRIVRLALDEDRARFDVTSRLLFKGRQVVTADMVAKERGVICGIAAAIVAFKALDRSCAIETHLNDGDAAAPGRKILRVKGDLSAILAAERSALNIIQRLSGIATLTRRFADQVKGTRAKIYDTRKTAPGLRALEKYAVLCGGGRNHRMHLQDAAMVKDNHLKALFESKTKSDAMSAILRLRSRLNKQIPLMIEADTSADVALALDAGADVIMLDNMTLAQVKKAVRQIRSHSNRAQLPLQFRSRPQPQPQPLIEVTGGVSLANVRAIARCGVDRISVGRITHSAPSLDISLDVE